MNIAEQLKSIEEQRQNIFNRLYDIIEKLPQNNDISDYKKFGSGGVSFTIKISDIIGKPWNPHYYDFTQQYKHIVLLAKKSSDPIKLIAEIVNSGKYKIYDRTYHLHNDVIQLLKNDILSLF